jgi:two-component system, NarL family, sensor histidine kinase UhpB
MFEAERHGQSEHHSALPIGSRTFARALQPHALVRELHDTVIQPLSCLLMSMTLLESQPSRRQDLEATLTVWKDLAQEAIDALRLSLAGLEAPVHNIGDLPQALRCLLLPQFRLHGLRVTLENCGWPTDLPPEWNVNLYLALREALTNVVKHSRATEVAIQLAADSTGLAVMVKDNGRGLPTADWPRERHTLPGYGLGINSMRERIALLDGKIALSTAPGRGVQVDIRLPHPGSMDRLSTPRVLASTGVEHMNGQCIQ